MATAVTAVQYVGFLTRTLAFIIDAILLGIASGIINGILFQGDLTRGSGLQTLIGLAYYLYFWSESGGGQTLGMRTLNIKVTRTDGTPVSLMNALIRYLGLIVSFVCLLIGVIWVAFDARKQGWHDKFADTVVVRV